MWLRCVVSSGVALLLFAAVAMADEWLPQPTEVAPRAGEPEGARAAIVQLLAAYAQFADAKDPDRFGALFTDDAVFRVVQPGDAPPSELDGRAAIVAMLQGQHAALRERGAQRRHLLVNPLIFAVDASMARVAVSLLLVESVGGGAAAIVGSGRYDGRLAASPEGWRIAEWTLRSDQTFRGELAED